MGPVQEPAVKRPATAPSPAPSAALPDGLSIVIPCYNSADSLPPLVERLTAILPTLAPAHEIILVNDASRDRTWAVIEELAAAYPAVIGVNLMRNYGQHSATLCGVRAARYAVTVTMDDDLQHPPEELPALLAALTDEVDVVYGAPQRERHGLFRDLASQITKMVLKGAMGAETARHVSAWRAFRTRLRDAFAGFKSSFVSIDVLLTWGTQRFTAIKLRHEPRTMGTSNYTLRKLVTHAINMMTGFSTIPLQVASFIGFTLTGFGVVVLVLVMARYLVSGGAPPGFPFLACIIAIFSGAQLLCLGIIGEYLGRAHFRLLDRPAYVVRTSTAEEPAAAEPARTGGPSRAAEPGRRP